MTASPPTAAFRWRPPPLNGPALMLALLGVNVWATMALVPALWSGAARTGTMRVLLLLPLLPLAIGVLWRRAGELLLVFPMVLLVPLVMDGRMTSSTVYSLRTFALAAGSLIGFLVGAAVVLAQLDAPARAASERSLRPRQREQQGPSLAPAGQLQPAELPERWRRRFRLYGMLGVLSAVFPLVLVYAANFLPAEQKNLREVYPGRVASIQSLINLIVFALWAGIYGVYFLAPLRAHRTGDKELTRDLARLKESPRRPGWIFYVSVVAALAGLILFSLLEVR